MSSTAFVACGERKVERAVRPLAVVVLRVDAEDLLEVAAVQD
jgi:hypothetical protein